MNFYVCICLRPKCQHCMARRKIVGSIIITSQRRTWEDEENVVFTYKVQSVFTNNNYGEQTVDIFRMDNNILMEPSVLDPEEVMLNLAECYKFSLQHVCRDDQTCCSSALSSCYSSASHGIASISSLAAWFRGRNTDGSSSIAFPVPRSSIISVYHSLIWALR